MPVINFSKIILFLSVLFVYSTASADALEQAKNAFQNAQFKTAVTVWTQLAEQGNSSAQFNLAKQYNQGTGVQTNQSLSGYWYKQSAQSGLVQAYIALNKNAIKPAGNIKLSFDIGPEFWLANQKPSHYTIQIASSRNKNLIEKRYQDFKLKSKGGYFNYKHDGSQSYVLLYGAYKSVGEANAVIANLPADLKKWTPWVRKISQLQKLEHNK